MSDLFVLSSPLSLLKNNLGETSFQNLELRDKVLSTYKQFFSFSGTQEGHRLIDHVLFFHPALQTPWCHSAYMCCLNWIEIYPLVTSWLLIQLVGLNFFLQSNISLLFFSDSYIPSSFNCSFLFSPISIFLNFLKEF